MKAPSPDRTGRGAASGNTTYQNGKCYLAVVALPPPENVRLLLGWLASGSYCTFTIGGGFHLPVSGSDFGP